MDQDLCQALINGNDKGVRQEYVPLTIKSYKVGGLSETIEDGQIFEL